MNIILVGLIASVILTIIVWAISRYIQHTRRVRAKINEQKAEIIAMIEEAVDETLKVKRVTQRPRPVSPRRGLLAWSKWGMGLAWLPFFVALVFVGAQSLSTTSSPIPAPAPIPVPSPAAIPAPTPTLTRVPAHVGEIFTVVTGTETDSTGLSSQRKLAIASDGSLHVTYTRKDHNGISQIYHAESNNGGETWTEEQITNAPRRHGFPSIAIDSKDNIHVAWEYREGSPGGSSETCAIQYRVKTTTWQPIEDVIRNQSYPSIAIDSEDNVHLVVGGYWGGAYNAHYVKYVKRGPSGWGSPETVSSNGWANAPAIAIDQNNNVHVVYTHSPKYGSYSGLRYRERIPSGWQSEEIIQEDDQGRGLSSMALDSSSNVYVVWDNADAGGIKIRKRTSSGWQATGDVYTESGYSQKNPVISIDGNDYLHVVWQGKYSESPDYYQIRHRRYTTSWQPLENLTSSIADNQSNPSLMWAPYPAVSGVKTNLPGDGYHCVWVGDTTVKYLFMSSVATTTPPTAPSPSQVQRAETTLLPTTGIAGTTVTLEGTGFIAGKTVSITYDGNQVATTTVTLEGSLSVTFAIPSSQAGQHTIAATDGTHTASKTFIVLAPTPPVTVISRAEAVSMTEQVATTPEGKGVLSVGLRYADGKPMVKQYVYIYTQKQDVAGNWVRGDQVTSRQTDNAGKVSFNLTPGHYALRINNLMGYNWGNMVNERGEANVAVRSGQSTVKRVDMGRLIVGLTTVQGEVAEKVYVYVYTQKQDASGKLVQDDQITSRQTGNSGMVSFDLTPGQYAIRFRRPGEKEDSYLFNITVSGGKITNIVK